MKDLKARAIRGGFAKVCSQGASFALRIGSLMVLARLLDPKDFGLVGMVTAFTGVLNLFRDFGLSSATVQRVEVTDDQVSTLFWINSFVGVALWLLLAAVSPLVASFYREPRLLWVTIVLATGFFFNAVGVQHSAMLQRQMRFTALALIDIISLMVSVSVGIGMALHGFRYWSLVAMTIAAPLVTSICLWSATGWLPGAPRRRVGIHSMMRFGGTITLNGLVVYVAYNLEKVLLGRFWGAETVGIYGRAYQLINIPTDNLNSAVGEVAFSVLARVQKDVTRLRSYFLKGYSLVLALTVPITIACALFGNDLILVLLGPKWKEAVPIFRLLAPTILMFAMMNPFSWLLFSMGWVQRSLKIALVIAPLAMGSYLIGLPYGPKGVAFAYSTAMTIWLIPHILWCIHGTNISFWDIINVVKRPVISAGVAAALAFAVQYEIGGQLSPLVRLVMDCGILFAVYALILLYAMGQKAFYVDLIRGMTRRSSVDENNLAVIAQ
jgi:O-antigen/teichoic acid export membrane protein